MKLPNVASILLFLTASILLGSSAKAAETASIEQLEAEQNLAEMQSAIDKLQLSIDNLVKSRQLSCLKSFGHAEFCQCLSQNLAVGVSFEGYIAISTHSKEDLKYSTSKKEDQQLIDNALKTRETCVRSSFK